MKAKPLFILAAILTLGLGLLALNYQSKQAQRRACQDYIAALSELTFSLTRAGKESTDAYARSQEALARLLAQPQKPWLKKRLETLQAYHGQLKGKQAKAVLPAFLPELEAFREDMIDRRMLTLKQVLEINALKTSLEELILKG